MENDAAPLPPLELTADETAAVDQVLQKLAAADVPASSLGRREATVITLLTKLRVDDAAERYREFLAVLAEYGLTLTDLYTLPDASSTQVSVHLALDWPLDPMRNINLLRPVGQLLRLRERLWRPAHHVDLGDRKRHAR